MENDEVINDATQAEAFDITAENSNTVEADSININQTADVNNDTPGNNKRVFYVFPPLFL